MDDEELKALHETEDEYFRLENDEESRARHVMECEFHFGHDEPKDENHEPPYGQHGDPREYRHQELGDDRRSADEDYWPYDRDEDLRDTGVGWDYGGREEVWESGTDLCTVYHDDEHLEQSAQHQTREQP